MDPEELKIIQNKGDLNFYYKVDALKGEINCELKDGRIIDIYRTFVDPDLRGKGIANELMMKVIDYAEKEKYKIIPSCSFAVSFFKVSKNYQYLLAPGVNLDNPGSCRLPPVSKNKKFLAKKKRKN
ncbi:MAG: N-acetyltransferase [Spirochaetales bacterium]|nr:N-acetyltransferase [Spirochaetales bacterium]